ncbi:transcriptional regulator NarL [compost metagenome]
MSKAKFDKICKKNEVLTSIFNKCISNIKHYITGKFLYLLTDAQGVLISMDYNIDLESIVSQSHIRLGMFFTRQSCGVNAISEAMLQKGPVYLRPEQHEHPFFKTWHCFSTPLMLGDEVIGYLDISTIDSEMKSELIAITSLIPEHILSRYIEQMSKQASEPTDVKLTARQLGVLRLISQGDTVKSIAQQLGIKECTVKHHKKVIFSKLGAQSSTEAVSIASKLSFL